MNAQAVFEDTVSYAQYLAEEAQSETKHEWYQGRVYAMAGGSPAHAQIGFNVAGALFNALRGNSCRGASADQRIRVEATGLALYPDAVVFCPPARFDEEDKQALVNPVLIVEVLSPSSENYDRGAKFSHLSQIATLRDYLLVSQERVSVEHFERDDNDENVWKLRRLVRREDVLKIKNLEIDVPLGEIYEGLDVPAGLALLHAEPSTQ